MANKKIVRPPDAPKAKAAQSQPKVLLVPIFPFSFTVKMVILAVLSFVIYAWMMVL